MNELMIYDLDDTLTYSYKTRFVKMQILIKRYGVPFDKDNFRRMYGGNFHQFLESIFGKAHDLEKIAEEYDEISAEFDPIGDVSGHLKKQSERYAVGIITNGTAKSTENKLKILDLHDSPLLKFVYTLDDMEERKPSPKQIESVLTMGFNRTHITYIGDSIIDCHFAQNAGVDFYGVLTGVTTSAEFLEHGVPANRIFENIHLIPR